MVTPPRECISFDTVIVGAGPAGLSAAIRLAQLATQKNKPISIAILEKGASLGAHTVSGAVLNPNALTELLPDWKVTGAPLFPVTQDAFQWLTAKQAFPLPLPATLKNQGNFLTSISQLCAWLGKEAEKVGIHIFTGFAAVDLCYDEQGNVCGVRTGDKGTDRHGKPSARYQPGIDICARYTLLAEGCRGSLTQIVLKKFNLRENVSPQTYGIGLKERWEILPHHHRPGSVLHTVGWPLDHRTYGGTFIYHLPENQLSLGMVIGLDYENPYLDPYETFQQFKTHPTVSTLLTGGRCLEYGARALNEGGWQCIPRLDFPGGLLIGDAAGFLDVPHIKGIHMCMKSGKLAAEYLMDAWDAKPSAPKDDFKSIVLKSWVGKELFAVRNIRPAFQWGLWPGLLYSGLDLYFFKGKLPWTFSYKKPDHQTLKYAKTCLPIAYPPHDGVLTFDKSTALSLANLTYQENQPNHLILHDPTVTEINYTQYASPETRYCPAGVYEVTLSPEGSPQLQIHAIHCIHCKACDIKDPRQNITWTPPEGGDGPTYQEM